LNPIEDADRLEDRGLSFAQQVLGRRQARHQSEAPDVLAALSEEVVDARCSLVADVTDLVIDVGGGPVGEEAATAGRWAADSARLDEPRLGLQTGQQPERHSRQEQGRPQLLPARASALPGPACGNCNRHQHDGPQGQEVAQLHGRAARPEQQE